MPTPSVTAEDTLVSLIFVSSPVSPTATSRCPALAAALMSYFPRCLMPSEKSVVCRFFTSLFAAPLATRAARWRVDAELLKTKPCRNGAASRYAEPHEDMIQTSNMQRRAVMRTGARDGGTGSTRPCAQMRRQRHTPRYAASTSMRMKQQRRCAPVRRNVTPERTYKRSMPRRVVRRDEQRHAQPRTQRHVAAAKKTMPPLLFVH